MAANEMVTTLQTDLKRFAASLDQELNGLRLVMIFQKKMAIGTGSWTLCISADALDEMSGRTAIGFMLEKLSKSTQTVASAIDRVIVLRTDEPALAELLLDIDSEQDAKLLIGRSVFDRKIARAKLFLVRHTPESAPMQQSLIA